VNEERRVKQDRIAGWLGERGLDGVVLTRRCNFSWCTGGAANHVAEGNDVGVSSLVVTADAAAAVANNIEAARLGGEALPDDIKLIEYPYHDPRARVEAFPVALGGGGFAADTPLEGLDLAATDAEFDRLRWQLTTAEIARYRTVCRDTAESVEAAARGVSKGMTEADIAARLAGQLRARSLTPWVLLIGADERIRRYRHPLPTRRPLEDYAMLVTCAERGGLIAAVSRLVSLAAPSDELHRRHRAVTTVDAALIAATKPGATLGNIFVTAQEAYREVGFADEWELHHQGGSIGYLPREVKAAPGCEVEVLVDQAFAWNPSITGTKCEDTILAAADGPEILTDTGDWPAIEASWGGNSFSRPDILTL